METDSVITSTSSSSPIQSRTPVKQKNLSPTQSPAASTAYNALSRFKIPVLPEYTVGQNGLEIAANDESTASQAILLGIQGLEKQQAQSESKRQSRALAVLRENPFDTDTVQWKVDQRKNRPQDLFKVPMTVHVTDAVDDERRNLTQPAASAKKHSRINSIGKLLMTPLKPIKRTISDIFNNDPMPMRMSPEDVNQLIPILFGYLYKLGRNNKWQKRWFEIDGKELKYYKSKKKEKCLATLSLLRVGPIRLDESDTSNCTFTIEVAGRKYYLCTGTQERTKDWVINLNRVREATAKEGGLTLDFLVYGHRGKKQLQKNRSGSDSDNANAVARVGLQAAARPRTKGLGKEEFSEIDMEEDERNIDGQIMTTNTTMSPSAGTGSLASSELQNPIHQPHFNLLLPNVQHQVAVRWTKQRSAVQNWARRLSRWTKRMTMARCVIQNDVVHLNSMQQHRAFGPPELEDSGIEDNETDFIDLDIAHYSYGKRPHTSRQNYDSSVDHSANSSLQHSSSSWPMQKNDPLVSTGSSVQSFSDDISGTIA